MSENVTKKRKTSKGRDIWKRFKKNRMAMVGLVLLAILIFSALFANVIAPFGPDDQNLQEAFRTPSLTHLFGTDNFGRDIFSRIIYGSRVSLVVGIIAVGIGVTVGGTLGAIAAYYSGPYDTVIMRMVDIMMAIPSTILAISISAALGPGIRNTMIAVGIGTIPTYTRVFRSSVITVKNQEYIEAAQAVGASNRRIILKHVVPNALAPLIVQASLGVATAILSAAALSFIGLGIQPPNPEWGAMLSYGRGFIREYPHMVLFPGLAIMIIIFSLNLLGDGLRDALDPRLKK